MAEVRPSYIENIPFSKYCRKRTFIIDRKNTQQYIINQWLGLKLTGISSIKWMFSSSSNIDHCHELCTMNKSTSVNKLQAGVKLIQANICHIDLSNICILIAYGVYLILLLREGFVCFLTNILKVLKWHILPFTLMQNVHYFTVNTIYLIITKCFNILSILFLKELSYAHCIKKYFFFKIKNSNIVKYYYN